MFQEEARKGGFEGRDEEAALIFFVDPTLVSKAHILWYKHVACLGVEETVDCLAVDDKTNADASAHGDVCARGVAGVLSAL